MQTGFDPAWFCFIAFIFPELLLLLLKMIKGENWFMLRSKIWQCARCGVSTSKHTSQERRTGELSGEHSAGLPNFQDNFQTWEGKRENNCAALHACDNNVILKG